MTKHDNSKPIGCRKSSSKGEVYSNTILTLTLTLHLETRKISNRQPNFIPKMNGNWRTKKKTKNKTKLVEGKTS